ncbi:hypothetical protein F1559_000713 [Cyanidiococcus yangmingshanensis]|uniref:Uncharacterized protein n=1 Tax=Cyanidiococcus yangmingshanensis TaxID=2690220 RepID=A0A7J7IIK2_9RHOD|nr:hypothetical protein F1559_000713 [Cyanidiococcus yangmingshanensis]
MDTPLRLQRPCSWIQATPRREPTERAFQSERKKPLRVPVRASSKPELLASAPPLARGRRLTALRRTLLEGEGFVYHGLQKDDARAFQAPRRLQFDAQASDVTETLLSTAVATASAESSPPSLASVSGRSKSASKDAFGSQVLMTPVRASPAQQRHLGSDLVLSPVRISARRALRALESTSADAQQDVPSTAQLLARTNWTYSPNHAIAALQGSSPRCHVATTTSLEEWRQTLAELRALANRGEKPAASPQSKETFPGASPQSANMASSASVATTVRRESIETLSPDKQVHVTSSFTRGSARPPAYVADGDAITFHPYPEQIPCFILTKDPQLSMVDLFLQRAPETDGVSAPPADALTW